MPTPSLVRWMLLGLGGSAVLAGASLLAPDLRRAVTVAPDAALAPPPAAPSAPDAEAPAVPPQMAALSSPAAGPATASGAPAEAARPAAGPAAALAPSGPRLGDPPRFDVVRVGARGIAVIAGRAQPGAEVVLFDDEREIGRTRADARGEWVILPADPLRPGSHALRLRARLAGEEMAGPDTLVVLVPEPPPLVAAAPAPQGAPAPERGPPLAPPPAGAPEAPAIAPSLPNPPPNFAARDGAAAPVRSGDAAPAPAGPSGTATGPGASGPSVTAATPFAVLLPPPAPLAGAPGAGGADAAAPRVLQASSGGPAPAGPAGAPARAGTGAAPRLALEAVEYDESGAMRFSGTAAPGAAVRLYVDQRHAGDARADAAGRWAFLMTEAPSFGVHTLRVDQVVADGTVAARIELPFQRDRVPPPDLARRGREAAAAAGGEAAGAGAAAGASPPVAQAGRIIVQPGHNLWRIARETYGRGVRYTIIYQANREQIRDPDLIYPGQIFALPAPEAAVSAAGQPAPAESSRSR